MIICDPKSELYETTSQYLREQEYTVRVFNLVSPEHSDSWACLSEIKGDELMTQLFCDVIIKNTGDERGDHFGFVCGAGLSLQRKKPQKTRMKTFRFNQKQRKICWGKKI